jgi:hypothetical protein
MTRTNYCAKYLSTNNSVDGQVQHFLIIQNHVLTWTWQQRIEPTFLAAFGSAFDSILVSIPRTEVDS